MQYSLALCNTIIEKRKLMSLLTLLLTPLACIYSWYLITLVSCWVVPVGGVRGRRREKWLMIITRDSTVGRGCGIVWEMGGGRAVHQDGEGPAWRQSLNFDYKHASQCWSCTCICTITYRDILHQSESPLSLRVAAACIYSLTTFTYMYLPSPIYL